MNKFFKVKWNAALKRYDVTSEITKGKAKSGSAKNSSASAIRTVSLLSFLPVIMSLSSTALADNIELIGFDPKTDNGATMQISDDKTLVSTGGGFSLLKPGERGFKGMTLRDAIDEGYVKGPGLAYMNSSLDLGTLKNYSYLDPITDTYITFQAYDSSQIGTVAENLDKPLLVKYLVGENGQYVDRNLVQVKTGGKLDVNVGSTASDWMNDPQNRVFIILKSGNNNTFTSSVFKAEAGSTLNYNSKTVVNLGNTGNNQISSDKENVGQYIGKYTGTFTSAIGTQTVNDIAQLKEYNIALIQAVKDRKITGAQYQGELSKAYEAAQMVFIDYTGYENDPIGAVINRERVAYILADGKDAAVNIDKDANLQKYGSNMALVRLDNGGQLTNEGVLGAFANSSGGSYIVLANSSNVLNNGVIDGGTHQDMQNFIAPDSTSPIGQSALSRGVIEAVRLNENSTMTNNGVINVAARQGTVGNVGVSLYNSQMTNAGSINLSASQEPGPLNSVAASNGVLITGNSTFINDGEVYVGRMAQSQNGEIVADVAVNNAGNRLTYTTDTGSTTNNGIMTIGSQVQGAKMAEIRGYNARFTNNGVMNINGAVPGDSPLQNVGVWARLGSSSAVNATTGVINLNGINAVGMKADSTYDPLNQYVRVTNSGIINVNKGTDSPSGTGNFGMWAEGDKASAINDNTINLQGDGAVGAHARDQASLRLTNNASTTFRGGMRQTGYYVFGSGASLIDASTGTQTVSTKDSTLYRIDAGASFDGSSSNSRVDAAGENATAVLATSATDDEKSNLITGNMTLTVSGQNAVGIRVEGSAQGILSEGTTLSLTGSGSSAGYVDGNYTNIQGASSDVGTAKLTSFANLDSINTASGAIGYIARNGGTLDHLGTIDFTTADSTGVLVDGGTLNNGAAGSISVDGTAVNIQGADSKVTNAGTVEATDGTAAFLVGNNAHLDLSGNGIVKAGGTAHGVLLDIGAMGLSVKDATIDMQAGGSGNGIENRAEIAGIMLDNTTINVGDGTGVRTAASLADTNSGTINVEGSGTGIYFGHANGSATTGNLDTSGSSDLVINVNDAAGKGIVTNTSGDVKSGASVNVNDVAGDAALIVGGTTSKVEQSGVLTSKSLTSAVIDVDNGRLTSFINRGDIIANSAAQEAIKVTLGSNIDFTNATGGNIVGRVDLSDGNNRVTLEGGSTATDIITGSGDDSYYLNNISAAETGLFTSLQAGNGSDTLNLNNSSLTVTDQSMLTGFEKISLSQASLLNLSNTLLPLGDTQNDGTGTGITLHDTSMLKLSGTTDTAFASHIAGTGTLATDLAGQAFDFTGNNATNTFTGTLGLGNATFDLTGENTQALTTATLRADNGGIVTVGTGSQAIGGLAFGGGTVKFNTGTPGHLDITTTIAAQKMDLSGHGTVEISAGTVVNNPVLPPERLSVLEQDDSGIEMQLASSATPVIADGGNLVLKDQFGNIITDALTREVEQSGVQVANATYDYRLTSGSSSDGLYVNYGLTQLDLQGLDSNALSLNAAGKTGNAADLSARVTGSGDLAVDGGNASLSNMDNDYLGKTFIRSGSLSMLNDNVLGKTSELAMSTGTGFTMNGHSQTVGAVNTAAGSLIDLDGGDLTVSNGGTLDGDITGAGTLNLAAGLLNVHGANGSLTAVTNIASGAQALLNDAAGLGQGSIVTDGILGFTQAAGNLVNTLSGSGDVGLHDGSDIVLTGNNRGFIGRFVLDNGTALSVTTAESLGTATVSNEGTLNILTNTDWMLTNSVSGSGSLNKNGGGIMTLTQDAAGYTGTTAVNSGGLMLGTASSAVTLASSQTDVAKDALFGGFGGTAGSLNNGGTFIVGDLTTPVTRALPTASTFTVGGDLNNSGNVRMGHVGSGIVGNNLNVAGDYHGDNGRIHFNTALGGDNSLTDHMTVNGNTSGTTAVSVSNAGGLGGKTINGIELIAVRGVSEGEFTQDGRIVAGAYDYMLARGKGENAANWYLTSGQEGGGGGGGGEAPEPEKEKIVLITRPESGAYASNMAAANTLFNTRLQDRLGETHYVDALTGEQKVTSMWLRNVGGHTRSTDSTGQLHTQANRWLTQLGGDVAQWSSDGADRYHLGVMAGYANQHSSTRNNVSGHSAKGSIDGYSTGIYATWLQDNEEKTGAYVDSWAQYSWFNNTVAGDTLKTESYKSDGITASVEAGYTWKLGEKNDRESYYIQPKAQVVWMGVEMDNVNEVNGTRVSGSGDGNIQTRLGVRAFIKGHNKVDEGKQRTFEPFVEANWIANTKNFGSTLNGVNVSQRGTKNIGELKVGVEGQINPNLNLWGNIGQQMGDKGYSDSSAMLGVKVNF